MQVIRKMVRVGTDGQIKIPIPPGFGSEVEVIVLPITGQEKPAKFFECLAEDGVEYKLTEWSEEEFRRESEWGATKDDDTKTEDLLDVWIGLA